MKPSVSPQRRVANLHAILILLGVLASPAAALDLNGNGLSDIWELVHGASALTSGGDANGDGTTNAQKTAAGVNPFAANSRPRLSIAPWTPAQLQLGYARIAGKKYRIESKTDLSLALWTTASPMRRSAGWASIRRRTTASAARLPMSIARPRASQRRAW